MSDILFYGYHPLIPLADKRKADPNGLSPHRNTRLSTTILLPYLNIKANFEYVPHDDNGHESLFATILPLGYRSD